MWKLDSTLLECPARCLPPYFAPALPFGIRRAFFVGVSMAEKLIEEMTVKLSPTGKRFILARSKQLGMESAGEYMRHLLDLDQARAASDLNLLADALGAKVIHENEGNQ